MKVKLSRAQSRGTVGPGQIDVTARTGRPEAPEWAWVNAYKAGQMSEEEYTRLYYAKLESVPAEHRRELWRQSRDSCGPAAAVGPGGIRLLLPRRAVLSHGAACRMAIAPLPGWLRRARE